MNEEEHEQIGELINKKYLKEDLEPIKCFKCESKNIAEKVVSIDCGFVSEAKAFCADCSQPLGYFAYGYWQV